MKTIKEDDKDPKYYSEEEQQLLWEKASLYQSMLIFLYLRTGLRLGELLSIEIDKNLRFSENEIFIANTKNYKTQNKKDKIIPMIPELKKFLLMLVKYYIEPCTSSVKERQPHQMKYLICHKDGSKMKYSRTLGRLSRKLKLNKGSNHIMRHTFATNVILTSGDIYTLKEILGHEDIKTTEIYAHLNKKRKQEVISQSSHLSEVFVKKTIPQFETKALALAIS